jgi:hypothetical protein
VDSQTPSCKNTGAKLEAFDNGLGSAPVATVKAEQNTENQEEALTF